MRKNTTKINKNPSKKVCQVKSDKNVLGMMMYDIKVMNHSSMIA